MSWLTPEQRETLTQVYAERLIQETEQFLKGAAEGGQP